MDVRIICVAALVASVSLTGCGHIAVDGELTGQAKKVTTVTPLFCENYVAFEMSMGVLQNGTGSVSTQDMWFTVKNVEDLATIKKAVETAAIVKVTYDTLRSPICIAQEVMTSIEIVPATASKQ